MSRKTLIAVTSAALLALGCMSGMAWADCPDKVACKCPASSTSHDGTYKTAGTIDNIPTCYKFSKGCRPWHCDGRYKNTDREYWTNKCRARFSNCSAGNNCTAYFPGAPNQ